MENKQSCKCKIDEVITYNKNDLKPAIINFEEGVLLKESPSKFKCKFVINDEDEDETDERKTMILVGGNDERFVGKIIPQETNVCRTLIMIRNKDTNKLKLIEVDQYNVMKVIDKNDDSDNASDTSENLYETNRNRLYKTFGSKKSLRNMELSQKTKVNVEVMKSQMVETASKITVNAEDLEVSEGNIDIYLPKNNREATQADGVYRLEDMLNSEELESLDEVAERVLADPPTESQEGSEFSIFFVKALKYLGNTRTPTQIKCLLYADAILYFLKLNMKNLKKKKVANTVCPFSKAVSKKIIQEFTVQTEHERIRPAHMIDKAVCWFTVLTVLACKFTLDTALVCPHLLSRQLDISRFEKMLRVIGLSSLNAGFWILKTPLPPLLSTKVRLLPKRKK